MMKKIKPSVSHGAGKGLSMPEDIGMTLIFLIALMAMILIGILIFFQLRFPYIFKGELTSAQLISYSIDFVSIANKPFLLAEVLSHVRFDDRQLLEQAIESAVAGSPEGASATGLPGGIKDFLETYDLKEYYVSINIDNNEIMNVQSMEFKCGDNLEGWCVFDKCDVGRVEIDQGENRCISRWQKCCKEDKDEYARRGGYDVVSCGGDKGVCSEGVRPVWPIFSKPKCAQNRIDLGVSNCAGTNNGRTPICCGPKTEETEVEAGIVTKATVPLLYKINAFGTLEVTAR